MAASSTSYSLSNAKASLDFAIEVFDEIFYEIAPIDSYNEPNKGRGVKIPFKLLSDRQCHLIKQFSGHLSSARSALVNTSAGTQSNIQATNNETLLMKKVNCLRDYLVNELNRSEEAEQQLKKKEEELVIITAERDKLQKKLASAAYASSNSGSNTSNRSIANVVGSSVKSLHGDRLDSKPESYVNSYIRKPFGNAFFFGLVANYDSKHAYFQIVYEDADYEDLTHAELRKVLWTGSTPSAKKEACMKHAKLLGIVTEAQYAEMVEANKQCSASSSSSSGSASSSSNMVGHVTAAPRGGRSTRQGGFEALDTNTVSADDDNLENTSETAGSPTNSTRGSPSPSSVPLEASGRTAAPSGGAMPARPMVAMVSGLSTGTDGDSRDSVVSLSAPTAAKTLAVPSTTAPAKSSTVSTSTTKTATVTATATASCSVGRAQPLAGVETGSLPQLALLQAMLKPTPAAALGGVTSCEKVKPPAKSGLHLQQQKLTAHVTQSSAKSDAQKSAFSTTSAPVASASHTTSSSASNTSAAAITGSTTATRPLTQKEICDSLVPLQASTVPAAPATTVVQANAQPPVKPVHLAAKSSRDADSGSEDSVVFVEVRSSPSKSAQNKAAVVGALSSKSSSHSGSHNKNDEASGEKNGKRKASMLTSKDALPGQSTNKKQHSDTSSPAGANASREYVNVE